MRIFKRKQRWLLFVVTLLTIHHTNAQDKSYWWLSEISRADGKAMRGFTLAHMEDIATQNILLVKEGNTFYVNFPLEKTIRLDTFFSFTGKRIALDNPLAGKLAGKLEDSIYEVSVKDTLLAIKFRYEGTREEDKRFQVVYEQVTEEKYQDILRRRREEARIETSALDAFMKSYGLAGWKAGGGKTPLKEFVLDDGIGSATVSMPKDFTLRLSRGLDGATFDRVKTGSFYENSRTYVADPIKKKGEDWQGSINIILAKAPANKFDLGRYQLPDGYRVVEKDDNSLHAIQPAYDEGNKKVTITGYISFKHLYKNGLHIFYLADAETAEEAREHYLLMKQLH